MSFVDVQDSTATNSITAASSKDSGNNTNWIFSATTITWDGSTDTTWNTAANWDLGYVPNITDNIVIANVANSPLLTLAVTVNDLTINTNAVLDLDTYDLTMTGTLSNDGTLRLIGSQTLTGVSFDANSGTTEYYGAATAVIMGDNTYYNLTCATAGKELDFEAGKTTIIINQLTLTGAAGNLIKIRSTTTGTQAKINPQGLGLLRNVSFVDVKDSNNINGTTINPLTSTDSGNTLNWFPVASSSEGEGLTEGQRDEATRQADDNYGIGSAETPGPGQGLPDDVAMASGSDLVSEVEYNQYGFDNTNYEEGDEEGPKYAEEKLLTSGQSATEEGTIPEAEKEKQAGYGFDIIKLEQQTNKYAKSYIPAKYRSKITAIKGEFDVSPYNESKGADYKNKTILKQGENLIIEK
ncbi:MAG: hypothetical protein HY761_03380 [Candidatus Omnitrophica bacterium]|nr:hypothetical protein [Candidatus Omnitrophota bacterium]